MNKIPKIRLLSFTSLILFILLNFHFQALAREDGESLKSYINNEYEFEFKFSSKLAFRTYNSLRLSLESKEGLSNITVDEVPEKDKKDWDFKNFSISKALETCFGDYLCSYRCKLVKSTIVNNAEFKIFQFDMESFSKCIGEDVERRIPSVPIFAVDISNPENKAALLFWPFAKGRGVSASELLPIMKTFKRVKGN